MAHDWPNLPDLIATVREFVEGVVPALTGQDRYHALCAIYLLEIVERELAEWQPRRTVDDERLATLADEDDAVKGAELVAALSARIRQGEFDAKLDALLEPLLEHVVAKVRVSKPSVLDEEHR